MNGESDGVRPYPSGIKTLISVLAGTIGGAIGLQSPALFVGGMNFSWEKVPYLLKAAVLFGGIPGLIFGLVSETKFHRLWVCTGRRMLLFALLSMCLSAVISFCCIMSIFARFL
jgi:hypothetical protein